MPEQPDHFEHFPIFGTLLPAEFLPVIGRVMVQHAVLDNLLQEAICILANVDYSAGVSFLSEILMTTKRADVFRNIARTKEPQLTSLCKMLVLADLIQDLSSDRNVVAHTLPYSVNADRTEIIYFKEENKTIPQIRMQRPYQATVASLTMLANEMERVGMWLAGLRLSYLPEEIDISSSKDAWETIRKHATRHPKWNDDAVFPWQDRFARKLEKERNRPENKHRLVP